VLVFLFRSAGPVNMEGRVVSKNDSLLVCYTTVCQANSLKTEVRLSSLVLVGEEDAPEAQVIGV